MAEMSRHDLFLRISKHLEDNESRELRTYVGNKELLPAGEIQHSNPQEIFVKLEHKLKLPRGDLSLLVDLMKKIGRDDFAKEAETVAAQEKEGLDEKPKLTAKRRRRSMTSPASSPEEEMRRKSEGKPSPMLIAISEASRTSDSHTEFPDEQSIQNPTLLARIKQELAKEDLSLEERNKICKMKMELRKDELDPIYTHREKEVKILKDLATFLSQQSLETKYKEIQAKFEEERARVTRVYKDCLIFFLDFETKSNFEHFWGSYTSGRLSDTLSRVLTADQVQRLRHGDQVVHVVRTVVLREDYRAWRDFFRKGLEPTTSTDNLLTLPSPARHVDCSSLRGLDLAVVRRKDQSSTDGTEDIPTLNFTARQVQTAIRTAKEKSQQQVRRLEYEHREQMHVAREQTEAIVRSQTKEITLLKEKEEKAQKILLEQKEENQKLTEANKSMTATIEEQMYALQTAKPKGGSQREDPGKERGKEEDPQQSQQETEVQLETMQGQVETGRIGVDAIDPIDQYREAIRQLYDKQMCKQQPLVYNEEFILDVEDTFTAIDILQINKRRQAYDRRPLESISDIFIPAFNQEESSPTRILLWGDPGIGKTTLIAKLLAEWSKGGADVLHKYDLVFTLALRKVGRQQSLVDCIFDQLLPECDVDKKDDLTNYLCRTDRVLIILDGYDELEWQPELEWHPKDDHDITKLLTFRLFPHTSVIVTTRPTHTSQLNSVMAPDTRVEILGFSPDNAKNFIMKFYEREPSKGEDLLKKIGPTLLNAGIFSVPIFLLQVCLLWEDNEDVLLSDKIYPLYTQVVACLVRRYSTGGMITGHTQTLIHALERLAFGFLFKGKTVFDQEDVIRHCGYVYEILVKLGLLGLLKEQKSPSRIDPVVQYSFSHKTMQEYFAAQCFSEMLTMEGTKRDILQQYFPSVRMVQTFSDLLVFTCGKLGENAKFVLDHLLDIYSTSDVQLVEEEFYNFFATGKSKKDWNKDIKLEDFASPEDLTQFAGQWNDYPQVLLTYQSYIELFLLCCHESGLTAQFAEQVFQRNTIQFSSASPRVCNVLSHMIAEGSEKVRKIEHLRLVNTQNYVLGSILEELHKLSGLTELNLRQSRLGTHVPNCTIPRRLELRFKYRRLMDTSGDDLAKAPALLAEKLRYLRSLKKLFISWNDLGPEDMKQILPTIRELTDLEKLVLSGNDLGGLGKDIADLVAFLPKMQEFKVFFCQLSWEQLLKIASSLKEFCPDLQLFDFQLNPIQPDESIWIGEREIDTVRAILGDAVFLPEGMRKDPPPKPKGSSQGEDPGKEGGKEEDSQQSQQERDDAGAGGDRVGVGCH